MDAMTVGEYWHSMVAIKATEQLSNIQANDCAWMKKTDRAKVIKSLSKVSRPKLEDEDSKPAMTTQEAAMALVRQFGG